MNVTDEYFVCLLYLSVLEKKIEAQSSEGREKEIICWSMNRKKMLPEDKHMLPVVSVGENEGK